MVPVVKATKLSTLAYGLAILGSLAILFGAYNKAIGLPVLESLGFVSGAWCIWLVVKENLWNWPLGLCNCILFFFVFFSARLYADAGLQIVYFLMGLWGWYWWLRGGQNKKPLSVQRASKYEKIGCALSVGLSTLVLHKILRAFSDSAPFLDALTTSLSLAAQYFVTRKFIENWYLWILANLLYVGLYIQKGLYLTAVLYGIFLLMCFEGLREWKKDLPLNASA